MRPGILIPKLVALALIWSGVAIVMSLTEDAVSSPEKVSQIVSEAPWRNGKKPSPAERRAYLDKLAKYYTLLDVEQRKTMREEDAASGEMMIFMMELTEEERKHYLSVIVEAQVQPLMKAWSLLSKDDRRKMIGNARGSLRRNAGGATAMEQLTEADAKVFDSLIEGNLADYYKNGTDKQKLNLAPLMEELQNRMGRR